MKILYAIQGTGNGHIARAGTILPRLRSYGQVDVLISGRQVDLPGDCKPRYQLHGLGFFFGKNGGIDLWQTATNSNLRRFKQEINSLPVHDYDLVISDFEPVSAWACLQQKKPCIGLSHQAAVLHENAPQPPDRLSSGRAILKYYAPVSRQYGFHFQAYGKGVFTPVIRDAVRNCTPREGEHYTVYLPAYSDERILECLDEIQGVRFEVFSKHSKRRYRSKNVLIQPIHDHQFLQSMLSSKGVLCGAGFETPAEALFLNKKLMVIPMKGQYEQQCNALALAELGVPVLPALNTGQLQRMEHWVYQDQQIPVFFPDETDTVIGQVISESNESNLPRPAPEVTFNKSLRQTFFQKLAVSLISA